MQSLQNVMSAECVVIALCPFCMQLELGCTCFVLQLGYAQTC